MSPDHPRVPLLIAVEGDATDEARRAIESVVSILIDARAWSIAPPVFVDEENDGVTTVGAFLEIYSGYPPWGERLPTTVDRAQLEEVREVLGKLADVSAMFGIDLVVEFNREAIGWIENGQLDTSLATGLLDEWERVIGTRERGGR